MRTQRTRIARSIRAQRGVTLLEMLLVVSVLAIMMSIGTVIVTKITRQNANQMAALDVLRVQRGAEEFTKTNFSQLLDPMAPNNISAIGSTRILTLNNLIAENYLPQGLTDRVLNMRMRVWLRNDTGVAAGSIPAIQIITATEPVSGISDLGQVFEWVFDTAGFGDGKLGMRANSGGIYNVTTFRSSSGSWTIPAADLSGYTAPLPAVGGMPRAYLAAYGRMTSEDVFDANVLYRVPVAGHPEYNQMSADLNMGGFDLVDVGTMTADNITAASMTLSGSNDYALTSERTLTLAGATTVTGNMAVYGDSDAGTVDLTVAGSVELNNGSAAVQTLNTGSMAVANDGLVARNLTSGNTTSMDMVTNNTATLAGSNVSTSNLQLGSAGSGNPTISANNFVTGNITSAGIEVNNATTLAAGQAHSIVNNVRIDGNATNIPSAAADEAFFNDMCYQNGPQDGINGC